MSAKKPAPKAAKGKKAPSRPAVSKTPAHKPTERAKVVAHPRRTAAPVSASPDESHKPEGHKPVAKKPAPPRIHTSLDSSEMHEASDPKPVKPESITTPAPAAVPTRVSQQAAANQANANQEDEADALEPGSLLAGPRNVQPYIAKRGEQYMNKEQLEHFRQILGSWKRDLMEEVDRTVTHMKDEAANFPDPNDRATQEEEFSLELRTRDRERKLIRKIEEALKRVEDGSYGYCLETGEEIGIKRLEARPVATLTLEAQERRERRERQYGDRDDRYR
jgi:DnaK suppressor protein